MKPYNLLIVQRVQGAIEREEKILDLLRRGLDRSNDVGLDHYVSDAPGTTDFIVELYRIFGFDSQTVKPEDIK